MAVADRISTLDPIREKVESGERLDFDDGVALLEADDLLALGELADLARRARGGGDEVYFVQNLYLNQTNVCRVKCKFCAFAKTQKQEDAYTISADELVEDAVAQRELAAFTEIHCVNGENPHVDLEFYADVLHMLRLRAQQDATGGFLAFIPLAFHPENTVFERRGFRFTTGADDLRVAAVSRLMLDNIPNVKAYWIMMGLPMAQLALHFGANDVQGTVVREQIFQAAGATSGTEQKIPELVRFIQEAGRIPVQRDTLYNELNRWAA